MAYVDTTRMVVEGAAVQLGDVVEHLGAFVQGGIHVSAGELEQVDVARVGVGTAAVSFLCRVIRDGTAVDEDVAAVVVGSSTVLCGGVVVDEGVVGIDGARVGIEAAAALSFIECHFNLVVFFLPVDVDDTLVCVDAATVRGSLVVGDFRLNADDAAFGFCVVLNVDVALVGVNAAAAVASLVATVGVAVVS